MIRAAILTVSDSTVAGTRLDISGPALQERCRELGWDVAAAAVVADEVDQIAQQLERWAGSVEVILTTGGTGVAPRDVTPEATRLILDREIPGMAELMRSEGLKETRFAVLSRGLAGTRGETFIANLPGSPAGAVQSLNAIAQLIPHVVQLLHGRTEHAAEAGSDIGN